MSERQCVFDVAKGFGIICVILGHLVWEGLFYRIVYPFHMPLFFLISGWFLNDRLTPKNYFIVRWQKMMRPYLFVSILLLIVSALLSIIKISYSPLVPTNMAVVLQRAIYASGSIYNKTPWNIGSIGAIWFLPASVLSTSFVRLVISKVRRTIIQLFVVFFVFGISVASTNWAWLPLSMQAAGAGSLFVYLGWLAKSMPYNYVKQVNKYRLLMIIWGISILIYEFYFHLYIEIARAYFPFVFSTVIGAIIICVAVILLLSHVSHLSIVNKPLEFLGRHSLIVMCYHSLLRFYLTEDVYERVLCFDGPIVYKHAIILFIHLIFAIGMTWATIHIKSLRHIFDIKEMGTYGP